MVCLVIVGFKVWILWTGGFYLRVGGFADFCGFGMGALVLGWYFGVAAVDLVDFGWVGFPFGVWLHFRVNLQMWWM